MVTTYRLHINELTLELLDSIKATFKDKSVEIIITDEIGSDSTQLRNYHSDEESFRFWIAEEEDLYQDYLKKMPE